MTKIAIIGTSALFPGASTPKEFWENLMSEKDLTSHATSQDFGVDPDAIFHPEKGIEDRCYSIRGGYIRDFQFETKEQREESGMKNYLDKFHYFYSLKKNESLNAENFKQINSDALEALVIIYNT